MNKNSYLCIAFEDFVSEGGVHLSVPSDSSLKINTDLR